MQRRQPNEPRAGRWGRSRRRGSDAASPPGDAPPHLIRYVDGGRPSREPDDASMRDAVRFTEDDPNRMVMHLYPAPDGAQITELADAWDLHPILVEDLGNAHQRPKLERYGDVLFLVARSARYIDEVEDVDFAEFHVLVRPRAVAVLCQDGQWIDGSSGARFDDDDASAPDHPEQTLLADEELLRLGPEAIVYRLLDAIVDGYPPVLQGVAIDKEQIERQVFGGDPAVAERIYRLNQEVIDLQQAITSLTDVLDALRAGFDKYEIAEELRSYLDDVADHLTRSAARTAELREALSQILQVNGTLVSQRQNEDMKKISGWAAILFAPTLIGAIYGMNFDVMPETHWTLGYPMAILMMIAVGVGLYIFFKRRKWM